MKNYLTVVPNTRVNENWISNDINAAQINKSFRHELIKGEPNSPETRFQPNFYKKVALDIVAETVYNYPYPCITEKTLRPIACKKMFIVLGPPGILQLLHRKGFRTFGDVVDESYDSISDPNDRFFCVQQSVLKFVSMPLQEIKSIIEQRSDVLEHNFQRLLLLEKLEIKKIYDHQN